MIETKTVVAGPHGPVPTEENTRRYISDQPTEVPMSTYYLRRMMSGELVEYVAPAEEPMTMMAEPENPVVLKRESDFAINLPLPAPEEK